MSSSVERLVQNIAINENQRPVLQNRRDYEDWQFFAGKNTITNMVDVFAAAPVGASWEIHRWSGKKGGWQFHNTVTQAPSLYLDGGYDKVRNVRRIGSVMADRSGQQVASTTRYIPSAPAAVPTSKLVALEAAPVKKGRTGMGFNLSKVFGKIGKADKGAFAISVDGGVAVKKKDGTFVVLQNGGLTNMDTLAIDLDAFFYLPVDVKDVMPNDVVLTANGGVGFVTGIAEGGVVNVYDVNSEALGSVKPAKHFLLPNAYVTKVVSLLTLAGNPVGGNGAFNPLMLLLLSKGGGSKLDMKSLLLMSMLGGQGGGLAGINPLMLVMLLGDEDGGGMSEMLPLLLLTGGLGGAGGIGGGIAQNPLMLLALMGDKGGIGGDLGDMLPLLMLSGGGGLFGAKPA